MKATAKPRKAKQGKSSQIEAIAYPQKEQMRPSEPGPDAFRLRPWKRSQASADYAEKLKDPRWQRKRLEVMSRDLFTCRECCDTETTLHVHHRYYVKNREPWGYPMFAYLTLCDVCHKDKHHPAPIADDEEFDPLEVWERALDWILTPRNEEGFFWEFAHQMTRAASHGIDMEELLQRIRRTCDKIEEDAKTAQMTQQ